MSNAIQNSPKSGDSRRRRSRGGQNRRNNDNNQNRNQDHRQSGNNRHEGGQKGQKSNGNSHRRSIPKHIKLSFWQKLLKAIGLYKEPVRPPRPERRPDASEPKAKREPRQNNTRDARTKNVSTANDKAHTKKQNRERDGNRSRGGDPGSVENRRVYVGNLSYDVTESDLEDLFKGVGTVRRVEIVYNRNTHRSKGYGFVEMLDIEDAKRTVGVLHDQFFMGRKLTVSGAKSKDHEDAEKEEVSNQSPAQVMPVLAPINPIVEEVHSLVAEENHAEIPTEEFTSVETLQPAEEAKASEVVQA